MYSTVTSLTSDAFLSSGGGGEERQAGGCSLNFSVSENFLFVRKCLSKNAKFGTENPIFGDFLGKIEILSIHISFVRNLQPSVGKWQLSSPAQTFQHTMTLMFVGWLCLLCVLDLLDVCVVVCFLPRVLLVLCSVIQRWSQVRISDLWPDLTRLLSNILKQFLDKDLIAVSAFHSVRRFAANRVCVIYYDIVMNFMIYLHGHQMS